MLHWPLARPFVLGLGAVVVALIVIVEVFALSSAYERLGLDRASVYLILIATFLGSVVNLPLGSVHSSRVLSDARMVRFLGVRYVVPATRVPQRTLVAINVGGALVPAIVSAYLFFHLRLGLPVLIATAVMALIVHLAARPVAGVGIVVPGLLPPLVAAAAALVLGGPTVAATAYVAGVAGTLIGADVLNLHRISRLGAPMVSIGGAGTFDGVLLSGVVAVLIATL
jgi:uncharacterized membrane protein